MFFSLILAVRRVRKDPCEMDSLVEHPMVEKYDVSSSRSCNVNPPQGFALEKARENARKLKRWNHLKFRAIIHIILFVTLIISICNESVRGKYLLNQEAIKSLGVADRDLFSSTEIEEMIQNACSNLGTDLPAGVHSAGGIYVAINTNGRPSSK